MLALTVTVAFATPVVYTGTLPEEVRSRAVDDLGAPEFVAFRTLLANPPTQNAGRPVSCEGPSTPPGEVERQLAALETALLYLELDVAAQRVAEARQGAVCAHGAVDPQTLAALFVLDGILHEYLDDADGAAARFAVAVGIDPTVPWIDTFPPDRRQRFDAAKAAGPAETGVLYLHPPAVAVTVDGTPTDPASDRGTLWRLDLPAGDHLVGVGGIGVWIEVEAGVTDTLVVPAAYPDDALSWISDPRRVDLSALLAHGLGEGISARVVEGEGIWQGTTGRTDWIRDDAPPEETPRRARWPRSVVILGGAALVGGGVLAGVGWDRANRAAQGAATPLSAAEYAALEQQYTQGGTMLMVGYGLLGLGAGTTGIGLAFSF